MPQEGASRIQIEVIDDTLPEGFEALRADALAEGYRHMERLAMDWVAGTTRFDRDGEALVAARLGSGVLAGIGGLTVDPVVPGALRMRRFYVRPSFRRGGVGRELATALLMCAGESRPITVNAAAGSAAFWLALGFVPEMRDGHTHVLTSDPPVAS